MLGGWVEAAYEHELVGELTPVYVGERPIVLVRDEERLRAVDAVCPHRGANLGFGGRLDDGAIVCPFHGHRIRLGSASGAGFSVAEHPLLGYGGMIFVLLGEPRDNGLARHLERLARDHVFVPGFTIHVHARPELVVENAFDASHFAPVHGVSDEPRFAVRPSEDGEFAVEGEMAVPRSRWHRVETETAHLRFVARAFSPNLVISELEAEFPYTVITAATPARAGGSVVRVSLAVPRYADGSGPDAELCRYILDYSRQGIEDDAAIWEHMCELDRPAYTPGDVAVQAFAEFCAGYRA